MAKALGVFFLLTLAACSGLPQQHNPTSPCAGGEASYACQVQRYNDAAAQ